MKFYDYGSPLNIFSVWNILEDVFEDVYPHREGVDQPLGEQKVYQAPGAKLTIVPVAIRRFPEGLTWGQWWGGQIAMTGFMKDWDNVALSFNISYRTRYGRYRTTGMAQLVAV